MARLTNREEEVLSLVGQSMSCKQIARALAISEFTVRKHRASILHKMRLGTTVQLTAFAKTSSTNTPMAIHRNTPIGGKDTTGLFDRQPTRPATARNRRRAAHYCWPHQ
jgi:DNA-binding CsgD family transcriptional regulator